MIYGKDVAQESDEIQYKWNAIFYKCVRASVSVCVHASILLLPCPALTPPTPHNYTAPTHVQQLHAGAEGEAGPGRGLHVQVGSIPPRPPPSVLPKPTRHPDRSNGQPPSLSPLPPPLPIESPHHAASPTRARPTTPPRSCSAWWGTAPPSRTAARPRVRKEGRAMVAWHGMAYGWRSHGVFPTPPTHHRSHVGGGGKQAATRYSYSSSITFGVWVASRRQHAVLRRALRAGAGRGVGRPAVSEPVPFLCPCPCPCPKQQPGQITRPTDHRSNGPYYTTTSVEACCNSLMQWTTKTC